MNQSKKFFIKFEIFRSNLISVGNFFRTNFKIISGSENYSKLCFKTCVENKYNSTDHLLISEVSPLKHQSQVLVGQEESNMNNQC